MQNDRSWAGQSGGDGLAAASPAGRIELGSAPAIGRRARALAGLTAGPAAMIMLAGAATDTGTTHSAP
ncbi:hypothetical protein V6U90_28825 [Micromonospora sp. CPCC 206060]|uniref:hypothetical protein n=1 Tax=Micromonospora sp. CPCC 206060 TaxID=3122406 RepID=UPI002FF25E71